jgi:hypothetical protein
MEWRFRYNWFHNYIVGYNFYFIVSKRVYFLEVFFIQFINALQFYIFTDINTELRGFKQYCIHVCLYRIIFDCFDNFFQLDGVSF